MQVPAAVIGRLAVDRQHRGKGFGPMLLAEAIDLAITAPLAVIVVVVDAKDAEAKRFYEKFGFVSFMADLPMKLALFTKNARQRAAATHRPD